MGTMTHYESNLSDKAQEEIKRLVEVVAPEFLLEMIGDLLRERPGVYNQIGGWWCQVATQCICEALPGHPAQKDFPEEGKTIGEMVAYLMEKKPDMDLADCVDYTINQKIVNKMVADWKES